MSSSCELPNPLPRLSSTDQWIYFVGSGFSTLLTLILLLGFITIRKLWRSPGQFIFLLTLFDFMLGIHWLLMAFNPDLVDNMQYCKIVGTIGTFAGTSLYVYNISFCLFQIFSLRNALYQFRIPVKKLLIIPGILSLALTTFAYHTNRIGPTFYGSCSLSAIPDCQSLPIEIIPLVIALIYGGLGLITVFDICKNTSQEMSEREKRINYYQWLIILTIFLFFGLASAEGINLYYFKEKGSTNDFSHTAAMCFKICIIFVLVAFRFGEKFSRKQMKKKFCGYRRVEENRPSDQSETLLGIQINNKRRNLIYTILYCVIKSQLTHEKIETSSLINVTPSRESNSVVKNSSRNCIPITNQDFRLKYFDNNSVMKEVENINIKIWNGTLKIHRGRIFRDLILNERDNLDILKSIDLIANRERIDKTGQANGGKGGEISFFSYDGRIVIKTITETEMTVFRAFAKNFGNHFEAHPNSIIAKVYALLSFQSEKTEEIFNFVVQKNVCGFTKNYIDRVYDLKGSTYNRKSLHAKPTLDSIRREILKDEDFELIEEKFLAKREDKISLMKQAKIDAEFLRSNGLMDYSLLVSFVNKGKYRAENELLEPVFNPNASIKVLKSDLTQEEIENRRENYRVENLKGEFWYNFGIIDFLQKYNCVKRMEKFSKRLIKCNYKLDTSCQHQNRYAERFIQNLRNILRIEDS